MKIDQHDLDAFELCVQSMYDHRKSFDSREWIEEPCAEPAKLAEQIGAWNQYRKVKFFSPNVDNPAISMEAMDRLRIMLTMKHVELRADYSPTGIGTAVRALMSDLFEQVGMSDYALMMVNILHAIVMAPEAHLALFRHFPTDDKRLIMAFCKNQYEALKRPY